MATAQALGVDIASLLGTRPSLPVSGDVKEAYAIVDSAAANETSAAHLAAEALTQEPDFPEDSAERNQQATTEFDNLTVTLENYMSYKDYLDVTTKSGTNPYKLAQDELASKNATAESRTKMIKRLRDLLLAKHVKGVA
jgi:uncharacterized protein YfaQ (DUF2300 family)